MASRKTQKKKQPAKARRSRPGGQGNGLRVALAVLFLGGFLLGSLLFLARMREHYQVPVKSPDTRLLLEDVRVELESAMLRSGASLQHLVARKRGEVTELTLSASFPTREVLDELRRRLGRLAGTIELQVDTSGRALAVLLDGRVRYRLFFLQTEAPPVPAGARVVIIMDDLGRDLQRVRQLLEIDLPVTLSILPNTRHAAEVATLAHRHKREVMIHIPMEPLAYPDTSPGDNALLVKLSNGEIRKRFYSYLEKIPYAVGGNNHMGSRFTADAEKMRPVLEVMRGEGLFFIDSRTTGLSVAAAEARDIGVPVASRDMFLDNDRDVDRISLQIRKLALLAARRGSAIGICHPYPQTLEALRREQGFLRDRGVQVVPASALVQRPGAG